MARPREPIDLIVAKGKKNLTKAEIEQRRASEVQPTAEAIQAPDYLTAAQKKHFDKLAEQLGKIKIMGDTDVDTLARYVVAELNYRAAVKEQRKLQKGRPKEDDPDYFARLGDWYALLEVSDKRQDKYCKQASSLARDLGLTISSRCKLVVPKTGEEKPKVNKFAQFGKVAGAK